MDEKKRTSDMAADIEALCRQVEIVANIKVKTPRQFETLADAICNRTGALLSSTTLKRVWGYLREGVTPRQTTLNVLAQFCGWRNFGEFQAGKVQEIESGFVGTSFLKTDQNIFPKDRVRLFWHPSSVCEIEYLGSQRWRVVASEGTRLKPGDTFSCALIVNGEPLYLDNLCQYGVRPGVYVCGRKSGIRFKRIE